MRFSVVLFLLLLCFSLSAKESLEERVKNLENTMLDLEIKSLQSRIRLSGTLISEASYHNTEGAYRESKNQDRKYFANTLMLDANSSVTSNLNVFTTLQGSYFYGDTLQDSHDDAYSSVTQTEGDQIRILKAYFDYGIVPGKLVYSMGRLPTIYGPPQHHYIGEKRLGTYPSLAYSIPVDGMALSWNIKNFQHGNYQLTFRGIFSPGTKVDREDPWYSPDANSTYSHTGVDAEDDVLYSGMVELRCKKVPWLNSEMLFIAQYYHADFYKFKAREQRLPVGSGSALFNLRLDDDKMLTVDVLSGYVEFNQVFNTDLDVYFTYKLSNTQGKANVIGTVIDSADGSGVPEGYEQDLGAYWISGTHTGHSILTGFRYGLNDRWALGAEYLYSTLGSFQSSFYSYRITDFYLTVGQGVHFHMDYAVKRDLFNIVLGYSNALADWEYDPGIELAHQKSRKRREQLYLLGRIKF